MDGSSSRSTTVQIAVQRPHPNAVFHPHGDTATYRDLLLFEERLKMNAEMLRRRRRRYNIFLWAFVLATLVMAHRLLFAPPQTYVFLRALQGILAVVLITLVLFFASGMYEEKIRYAYSYLAHSNKALRPLNMHLNTRRPPFLQALIAYLPPPLRPLLSSVAPPSSATPAPGSASATATSPSPAKAMRRVSSSGIMPTIPPSSNPRGELIFSSRVDRTFREGYERYRSAFERRREEKERLERSGAWRFWRRSSSVPGDTALSAAATLSGEKGRAIPTPPHSRRSTPPIPLPTGAAIGDKDKPGARARTRTPSPSGLRFEDRGGRERAESYSFVWTSTRDTGPLRRAP